MHRLGNTGIHTNILTALSEEMSLPLCMIFKKSLDEGVVPLDWRSANVVPLYKKGAKSLPTSKSHFSNLLNLGKYY